MIPLWIFNAPQIHDTPVSRSVEAVAKGGWGTGNRVMRLAWTEHPV